MHSELTIKEILHTTILSCSPDTLLSVAAQQMAAAKCSSILVMDDRKAIGIWTEYDALALDFSDPEQHRQPISRFMSSPVVTMDIGTTIGEAALRFRDAGIRHFLVTDAAGDYKGIISQSDVVLNQGIEYFVSMRELGSVFTRQIVSIPGCMALAEAVREMHRNHLDAIVVRKADGEHGILTERDVVRLIGANCPMTAVQELASFPLRSLPLNATLYHARKLFMSNRVRHLGRHRQRWRSGRPGHLLRHSREHRTRIRSSLARGAARNRGQPRRHESAAALGRQGIRDDARRHTCDWCRWRHRIGESGLQRHHGICGRRCRRQEAVDTRLRPSRSGFLRCRCTSRLRKPVTGRAKSAIGARAASSISSG